MKEVIERCNWLVNKCEDKAITPDVKDDISYLLEEIERLNNTIKTKDEGIKALTEDLCEESTRIDKAIEYVKNNKLCICKEDEGMMFTAFVDEELLNILQGSDKE